MARPPKRVSLPPPSRKSQHNRPNLVLGLISLFWKHLHSNWIERNQALHGADATLQEASKLNQAKREISLIYSLRNQTLPSDRFMFYTTPQHHFEQEPTSRQIRQWITTWHPVILSSIQRSKNLGITGTSSICSYFSRTQSQHSGGEAN